MAVNDSLKGSHNIDRPTRFPQAVAIAFRASDRRGTMFASMSCSAGQGGRPNADGEFCCTVILLLAICEFAFGQARGNRQPGGHGARALVGDQRGD